MPNSPPANSDATRLIRWQSITVSTLFIGYAGYYICRSNLSVATPLLLDEYKSAGLTKGMIGDVASMGVLFYAIGKFINGIAADYLGGRRAFLIGIFTSVACTVLFAMSPMFVPLVLPFTDSIGMPVAIMLPFFIIWAMNRFVQSMGWGGLVQIVSRWFPAHRLGMIMGVLCMSYLLGDAVARLYLGTVISAGFGWQGGFYFAAGSLGAIGILNWFLLKGRPSELHLPEPPPPPANVYGDDAGNHRVSIWAHLLPLVTNTTFWLVCLMNVGLTIIRETFNLWTPTYLRDVVQLDPGMAGTTSLVFPLTGALSSVFAGWLVDQLKGRYGFVIVPGLVMLTLSLAGFAYIPMGDLAPNTRTAIALSLIAWTAFCLIAPYTFCSGVLAMNLGGQRGGSTSAGIIDTTGYLGATVAGSGIGRIAERYGWTTAFDTLAVVAAVTCLVAIVYTVRTDFRKRPPQETPAS